MPDPQQQTTATSVPAPDGGIDLSGLRVRTLGGIDLSGLRVRTLQQAQSELPQPKITPPWEEEPTLPTAPTSKLGKAYADGKQLLEKYGQHFSEKVLAPFREGLDRIGDQLQQAGESGHTQSGGALTGPTRALLSGTGALLKQAPVGRDIKSTALAWATPPELPEGKVLSRELNAWERTGKEIGTVYHGGKTTVGEVDPSKLQQRDAGFYGPGFYVTKNEQYAKTYGNKVSQKAFNPDATILDVGTIHPGYERKVNPELQKEIEATQRAYLTGLPKAQKNPNLVNDYLELIDPKSKSFDLHSWIDAVNRHAEQKGYDAIRFSDGEIVVKNPKALATDLSGLRTRLVQKPSANPKDLPAQTRVAEKRTARSSQTEQPEEYLYHGTTASSAEEIKKSGVINAGDFTSDLDRAKRYASNDWNPNAEPGTIFVVKRSDAPGLSARGKQVPVHGELGPSGEIIPLEKTAAKEPPASVQLSPSEKGRQRQLNLKNVGIGLTEMDPADAKNWVGYTNQKSLKIYRGVDDPSHAIEAGDYVTTSRESAQNYGKHIQELEVSPAELRYVRGHKDGNPKLLDQGGQTELIYAPKPEAGSSSTQIDLSGLRVRPVGAGRQPAQWTPFITSDGKKYRHPPDVTWEQILKADPGAKRIK